MKWLYLPLALGIALAACSEQESLNPAPTKKQTVSNIRSISEAHAIAAKAIGAESLNSRSGIRLKSPEKTHVIATEISRSGLADTLLYAIDVEDEGGFVVIAAPKGVEPIMAIIDNGSFDAPENLKNEPYQKNLQIITDYVEAQAKNSSLIVKPNPLDTMRLPIITDLAYYYDTIDIKRIQTPAVKTAWGQGWPENIYAPNGLTGCAPLAIAQMLASFETVNQISYTFPNCPINSESINWKEIKKHIQSSHPDAVLGSICMNCNATYPAHESLARIIREIGHRANADYSYEYDNIFGIKIPKTGVRINMIEGTIESFMHKKADQSGRTISSLYNAIDKNKGIAIVAAGDSDSKDGHEWIADGTQYIDYKLIYYEYDCFKKEYKKTILKETSIRLIHYNWGESGLCNGWFNTSAISPNNASEYDYPDLNNTSNDLYSPDNFIYWYYKL